MMDGVVGLIIIAGLVMPVAFGLGIGAYRLAQNPVALAEAGAALFTLFLPQIKELGAAIVKRAPAETEREFQDTARHGGEWDNFRKREREGH